MADENLYQYFKIEAREIVADLSRDILGLEKEGAGADLMLRLLRQAHTLKGQRGSCDCRGLPKSRMRWKTR